MLLLNGDCLEVMKTLPDKSIDLFVCDLPYGCLSGGAGKEKKKRNESGDGGVMGVQWDIKIDLEQFWAQVQRLMRDDHTPILHFCNARFGNDLINSKPDWFRYDLVWDKVHPVSFLLANKMPMRQHEFIYVFAKKGARYTRKDIEGDFPAWKVKRDGQTAHCYGEAKMINTEGGEGKRCPVSVIRVNKYQAREKGQHPTQKPADLYAWLIERYSKEGDTVLDPTAGSFTSVFTADRLGRNAIGIEKDETFYNKAKCLSSSQV